MEIQNSKFRIRNCNSKVKSKLVIVGFLVLIASGYILLFSAPSSNSALVLFRVSSGQSIGQIANNLKEQNLIRSKKTFLFLAQLKKIDRKIIPGRYKLSRNMNLQNIVYSFANPEQGEISVTIPEGYTIHEIDERLWNMGLIMPGEFEQTTTALEGYLFPDTYSVYKFNFNPQDLIKKMQDNFLAKITPELRQEIEKNNRTLQQTIIMASILEKEVRMGKDLPVVSGILWKRLNNDWPLQADATLLYGKTSRQITAETLSEDSAYNTRKNRGLPPTPIGNPGIATIRAAIFPEQSPYWFYLTDSEGNVHYAATNEQHNENRRKYL